MHEGVGGPPVDHYGWDRYWGDTYFGPDAIDPLSKPIDAETAVPRTAEMETEPGDSDPYLRGVAAVKGYHVTPRTATSAMSNYPGRRRQLGHPLSHHRHRDLAARQARPGRALCGDRHRLARTKSERQRHPRAGAICARLVPAGHGGQGRRAKLAPPFRLAGLPLVSAPGPWGREHQTRRPFLQPVFDGYPKVCPRRTIVVKADEATYRISDVDVTAKGCTLTMITSPAE